MTLNELVTRAHVRALKSGWWEEEKPAAVTHMLMVTELAEATEACRLNEPDFWIHPDTGKPEGESVELADVVIRIADYFGRKGWDLEEVVQCKMEYNETRPHRHGNKKF